MVFIQECLPTIECMRTLTENRSKLMDLVHRASDLEDELLCHFPKPNEVLEMPLIYVITFGNASLLTRDVGYRVQKSRSVSTQEAITACLDSIDFKMRPNVLIYQLSPCTSDREMHEQRGFMEEILSVRGINDHLETIIYDEENSHETQELAKKYDRVYCTEGRKLTELTLRQLHLSLFLFLEKFQRAICREFYRLGEELMSTDFISRNLRLKKLDLDGGRVDIEFDKMLEGPLEVNDRSLARGCHKLHRLTDIHTDVHAVALEANHLMMELSRKFGFLVDQQPKLHNSIPTSVGSGLLRIDGVIRYSVALERLIVHYIDREREDDIMSKVEAILRSNNTNIPVALEYRKKKRKKEKRRNIKKMSSGLRLKHSSRRGTLGMVVSTKTSDQNVYTVGFTAAHILNPGKIQDNVFVENFEIGPCIWPRDFDNFQYDFAVIRIENNIDRLDCIFPTEDGRLNRVHIHDSDVTDVSGLEGQIVFKKGASTGFRKGTIIRIEIEEANDDGTAGDGPHNIGEIAFIIIKKTTDSFEPFCAEGDSGSIVFSVDKEHNADDTTTLISLLMGVDKDEPSECMSCPLKPCIKKYESDMNETVDFQSVNAEHQ